MADDLYAGLEVPRAKRPAPEEPQARESVAAASDEQRPAKRQRALTVPETVAKLRGYMLVDKKFTKACALMTQLVADKLDADSKETFLTALTEMVDAKGAQWSGKPEFAALVQAVMEKKEFLVRSDEEFERVGKLLDRWEFLAVTHAQLFTDDTYQFSRASKAVKLRLERVLAQEDPESVAKTLHSDLMPVLRSIQAKLGVAWATTMVETVLAVCTRHRTAFSDADRELVDAWTKAVQDRRRAPAVARSAASEARRNIVALDASNASQAKPKVGVSNHPLFNRNA